MFRKTLLIPLHSNLIVANLVFAAVFTALILVRTVAGPLEIFLIPASIAFGLMFIQYCFDIGHEAVLRAEDPPAFNMKPIQMQAIACTLITLTIIQAGIYFFGFYIGSIVASLFIPAIFSSLMVQEQIVKAINPVEWIGYVWQLKLRYLFLVAILALGSLLISLIPSGLWVFPKLFLLQTVVIWTFYSLGISLNLYQDELLIQTPDNHAQKEAKYQAQQVVDSFNRTTDAWHRMVSVHKFDEALESVTDYLNSRGNTLDDLEQVMTEICSWRQTGLGVKLLPFYLAKMTELRKTGKAYAKYRLLCSIHGPIEIEDQQIQEAMLQFAMEMGDNDIVDAINAANKHNPSDSKYLI